MSYYWQALAGLYLLLSTMCVLGDEQAISHRFSGFASLGFVSNDNPDLGFSALADAASVRTRGIDFSA